ncbi:MAG: hypothetical protein GY820_12150 [Gammaproteobacteria bacterium]|nr:hypothetical protein [Gammaproteobacteria bacterium]
MVVYYTLTLATMLSSSANRPLNQTRGTTVPLPITKFTEGAMGDSETGQVSEDTAKIYEAVYLPALFQEWCPRVLAAANSKFEAG